MSAAHSTDQRFRFDPPVIDPVAELRFVLLAAFGPADALERASAVRPIDASRAAELAGRLRLDARIGARHGLERLVTVLERAGALKLWQAAAATERQAERLRGTARAASAAFGTSVPHTFLKFVALDAADRIARGAREAADVDVLVPADRNQDALCALYSQGFSRAPDRLPPAAHQLPSLLSPQGSKLEVHLHVPGLRLGGTRRDAGYQDLARHDLLVWAPRFGPGAHIPRDAALAAHALIHALAQHGLSPHSYPLLRVVADLIDLGLAEDRAQLVASTCALAGGVLSRAEWEGALALTRRLARGDESLFDAGALASWEGMLLRHMVAGATDQRYRESLKWPAQFMDLDGRYKPAVVASAAWRLLAGRLSRRPPTDQ